MFRHLFKTNAYDAGLNRLPVERRPIELIQMVAAGFTPGSKEISKLNRIALLAVALLLLFSAGAHADVIFKLSGTIPSGSSHSMVQNGETWEAIFQIDDSTSDARPDDPNQGEFLGAVVSGSLEFSGGFVSSFDFSGLTVYTADDLALGANATPIDGIAVRSVGSIPPFFGVITEDLSTLNSDELPAPGTAFQSNVGILGVAFSYSDEFGDIEYPWVEPDLHSFAVCNIPEPSSTGCIALLTFVTFLRRKSPRRIACPKG